MNLKADIDRAFDLALERTIEKVERLKSEYQPSNVRIEDGLVIATMYLQRMVFRTLGRYGSTPLQKFSNEKLTLRWTIGKRPGN